MIRYKIKPVLIDACKFDQKAANGRVPQGWPTWLQEAMKRDPNAIGGFHCTFVPIDGSHSEKLVYYIVTPQGPVTVDDGDYIVKGAGNVIFPIPAATFEKAYERIECNRAGVPLTACMSNGALL